MKIVRARRRGAAALLVLMLLAGCTSEPGSEDRPAAAPEPSRSPEGSSTPESSEEAPTPSSSPTRRPHPVSLEALIAEEYDGRGLRLVRQIAVTDAYRQYDATYRSGDLTITGRVNVPLGKGPFPALVLAHGYIDPAVYVSGQGLMREQDRLARAGYVTFHVDYRNHAGSDDDPAAELRLRLGYTEDVINAVLALRKRPQLVDRDRIGLVGRSMGGGVVYNTLVVRPGLVDAAVVFAPVSSDTVDNFDRWIRPDPSRSGLAQRIVRRYGSPERRPAFWRGVSPRSHFDRVEEPLMIHHGTSDDSCPIAWSHRTVRALERAGKQVRFHVYEGEEHAFVPQWPVSMERTTRFLDRHLR